MAGRRSAVSEVSRRLQPCPAADPEYPVGQDEAWAMFGLLLNFILADVAVTRSCSPVGAPPGFSPKLTRALLYLEQASGPMTVGELAEGLGISLGWASRIADDLATSGLIDRDRNEQDRRVVQLKLTKGARDIADRLWTDRQGAIVSALERVPPGERDVLARFVERLTEELERYVCLATQKPEAARPVGKLRVPVS